MTDFSSLFREKFPQVYADKASAGFTASNIKKYLQVMPVYTRQICDEVFTSEHFLRIKRADPVYGEEENSDDSDASADGENDNGTDGAISDLDGALSMKPLNVLIDSSGVGNSGERNVFEYKKLQKDLDCKFIHFSDFPTDFYVFAPIRSDGDRCITKIHLSVDEVMLPVALILTGQEQGDVTEDETTKALNINSLGMSPLTNAIHVKTERVNSIESCLEVSVCLMPLFN